MGDATPDELRALLERCGLSQNEAARRLEVSQREFRRMCAGKIEIPNVIMLALTAIAEGHQP